MKAIFNTKLHEAELQDVPIKEMEPEDIKVKMAYCAVGTNDIYMLDVGLTDMPRPWPLGYQGSGTVVEMGEKATKRGVKVGDRVSLNQLRGCGACDHCLNGEIQFCSLEDPNFGWRDGLMREYVVYNQQQINKLPDDVGLKEGALTENVAASMRGIEHANIKIGNTTLIIGGGTCGLVLLQLAKMQGGTRLTVVEPVDSKRELALKLGADYVIDPNNEDIVAESMKITGGNGFDRIIEASGETSVLDPCFDVIGRCGKLILFGCYPYDFKLSFDIDKIYMKEATLQTSFGFNYKYPRAIEILSKLDMKSLVGPSYPVDKWEEAFAAQRTAQYPSVLIEF